MSGGTRRRVEGLERMLAERGSVLHDRAIGRLLREIAAEDDIPCWTAAEDAQWRAWATEYAEPELRDLLAIFHDAVTARAVADGLELSPGQRHNPWRDETLSTRCQSEPDATVTRTGCHGAASEGSP